MDNYVEYYSVISMRDIGANLARIQALPISNPLIGGLYSLK